MSSSLDGHQSGFLVGWLIYTGLLAINLAMGSVATNRTRDRLSLTVKSDATLAVSFYHHNKQAVVNAYIKSLINKINKVGMMNGWLARKNRNGVCWLSLF